MAATDSNGNATFANISVPTAGAYMVVASDGTVSSGNSSSFTVSPAAAAMLVFSQQPSNAPAGTTINPSIVVDVEDQFGNLVTTDSSTIVLSLTGDAALNGTLAVQATNGVATFSGLSVNGSGVYTMIASDGSLAATTSSGFTVSRATPTVTISPPPPFIVYDGTSDVTNWAVPGVSGVDGVRNPTGLPTAVFYSGTSATGTPLASAPVNPGTYTVVATYLGDANYAFTQSDPVTFTINSGPTISSVSTTAVASSYYRVGGSIPITVAFREVVNVSGTPQLTLNDGGVANYTSGSGGSVLTFTYTVAVGQNTADLDYASTMALGLNGGSIHDLATNAAILTLPATGTDGLAVKNIVIDTTPPTVSVVAVTPNLRVAPVSSITVQFSEPVVGFDLTDLRLTLGGNNLSLNGARLTTTDQQTWALGNLAGITSSVGTYQFTLTATGSGIADLAGNPLLVGGSTTWRMVAPIPGDFNLDGVVDNLDKAIFFANVWTGKAWAQGDANGDGTVNGLDWDILVANFGRSIFNEYPAPSPPLAPASTRQPALAAASWLVPTPIQAPVTPVPPEASPALLAPAESGGAAAAKTAVTASTTVTASLGTSNSFAAGAAGAAAIGRADLLAAVMSEMGDGLGDSVSNDLADAMLQGTVRPVAATLA